MSALPIDPPPVPAPELAPVLPLYVGGPELGRGAHPCRCGHAWEAHQHHRPGTDCGACGRECPRYSAEDGAVRWLRRALRRAFT